MKQSDQRPPLPRALKLVIAMGCLLFVLPFLMVAGVETVVVISLAVAIVAVILGASFVMLRNGFSRRFPKRARKSAKGGPVHGIMAPLVAGALIGVGAPLAAHTIDRQSSFFMLDHDAHLVATIEVTATTLTDVSARVVEVFRAPLDSTPKPGDELKLRIPLQGIDSGTFYKGIVICFATKGRRGWSVVTGPYMSGVRTVDQYAADKRIDFLGIHATSENVREAMAQHPRLAPGMLARLDGEMLARARGVLGLKDDEKTGHTPLADQRAAIHRDWLASGNPLLAVSALVDAYELADAMASRMGELSLRPIPESMLVELEATALIGIKSTNWHIQSAALAIFERVGFRKCPVTDILALAKAKPGEHLSIVRCEAHRFLGEYSYQPWDPSGTFADEVFKQLTAALLDDTLRDMVDDWPAQGLAKLGKDYDTSEKLLKYIEPLLASEDWYHNEAGVRALIAMNTLHSNSRLLGAYKAEPAGELRDTMLRHLATWPSHENTALADILALPDATKPNPSELSWAAIMSSALVVAERSKESKSLATNLLEYASRRATALGLANSDATDIDSLGETLRVIDYDMNALERLFKAIAAESKRDANSLSKLKGDWERSLELLMSVLPNTLHGDNHIEYQAIATYGYDMITALSTTYNKHNFVVGFDRAMFGRSNAPLSMFIPQTDDMPHKQAARLDVADPYQTALMYLIDDRRGNSPDWKKRFQEFIDGVHGDTAKSHAISLFADIHALRHAVKIKQPPAHAIWKLNDEARGDFIASASLESLDQWLASPDRPHKDKLRHSSRPLTPQHHRLVLTRLVASLKTAAKYTEMPSPEPSAESNPIDGSAFTFNVWDVTRAAESLYHLEGEWMGYCPAVSLDREAVVAVIKRWDAHVAALPPLESE